MIRGACGGEQGFYPHYSFPGTLVAGDSIALQPLQRDLLTGVREAAGGHGSECI